MSGSHGTMMRTRGRDVGFWKPSGWRSRPLMESLKLKDQFLFCVERGEGAPGENPASFAPARPKSVLFHHEILPRDFY